MQWVVDQVESVRKRLAPLGWKFEVSNSTTLQRSLARQRAIIIVRRLNLNPSLALYYYYWFVGHCTPGTLGSMH